MMDRQYREFFSKTAVAAGRILLGYFGKVRHIRQKEHASSVVCEADVASEEFIIRAIRSAFPGDGIIGEESGTSSGCRAGGRTWVIDPLDGTSNFVAGIPWFGVQFGLIENSRPMLAVMYVPVEDTLYLAQRGQGVWRNGKVLQPRYGTKLKNTLCAFGLDGGASETGQRRASALLVRISQAVRNIRATNSLVDFCYTLEGRFGGCINLNCKMWDIVPALLMLPESGGTLTGLDGSPLDLRLGEEQNDHSYSVVGAGRGLHRQLLKALQG